MDPSGAYTTLKNLPISLLKQHTRVQTLPIFMYTPAAEDSIFIFYRSPKIRTIQKLPEKSTFLTLPKPPKCLFLDQKGLNHERKIGVGGFMNVHVDIGRWSMKCPYLSTWGGWVVRKGQNLVHVVFECPLINKFRESKRVSILTLAEKWRFGLGIPQPYLL